MWRSVKSLQLQWNSTETKQIYESSGFSKETGAALHVAPNANGILKRLGIDCAEIGANECLVVRFLFYSLGIVLICTDV